MFHLSGGGEPNSLNVLSVVSEPFKHNVLCVAARGDGDGSFMVCGLDFLFFFLKHTLHVVVFV